ncbi:MAG TPA: TldD/PmbA family protein [Candidatus Nanoarchaeia archaeon]|nr:TldD/PmbA family protein [Candidatus Nanoarchaeia archaeon]
MSVAALADFALAYAQKKGAAYAEVRLEQVEGNSFLVKKQNVEASGIDIKSGIGIRFLVNNRLGFVSTNVLDKDSLKRIIDRGASFLLHKTRLREAVSLAGESAHKEVYEVRQKQPLQDIDPKEKVQLLLDADKGIASLHSNVPGRWYSLSTSISKETLLTSEGTRIEATIPRVGGYYIITMKQAGRSYQRSWQFGATAGWEAVSGWHLAERLRAEVKAGLHNLSNAVKAPKGSMDVVVGPEVVGIMCHESVGHPFEADRILGREAAQAGESFITPGMIGSRIGSDVVTVVDDPTEEKGYGYYLFDNEGVKARRKYLIKGGMINEFLHNRQTAASMETKSNGSSRAVDYDKEPIVRMSNTFMLPGEYSEDELIEGVRKGVFMKNFMEWNIDDQRMNQKYVGAEAFLIRNGKLAEPVRNPVLEINTTKLWQCFDAVGKKPEYAAGSCGKGEPMQPIPVWFGGPSARLRRVDMR